MRISQLSMHDHSPFVSAFVCLAFALSVYRLQARVCFLFLPVVIGICLCIQCISKEALTLDFQSFDHAPLSSSRWPIGATGHGTTVRWMFPPLTFFPPIPKKFTALFPIPFSSPVCAACVLYVLCGRGVAHTVHVCACGTTSKRCDGPQKY